MLLNKGYSEEHCFAETTGCFDIKAICDKDITKIEQQNTLNTGIKNLFSSETPL